jgi:hypothetical protein
MMISLPELESAINYWRQQRPATGEEFALSPEVSSLANEYALMIYHRRREMALHDMQPMAQRLIAAWRTLA